MAKGKVLGPRATVTFAAAKRGSKTGGQANARYVYMLKSTAEKLGFKIEKQAAVKTKKGATVAVRGAVGGGTIKVPSGEKDKEGRPKMLSIPVPANATINEIRQFLLKAGKKPESFVSPNGRTYPVVTK